MITAAILTASDRSYRGEREDVSGKVLENKVSGFGIKVTEKVTLPDQQDLLEKEMARLADEAKVDLIFTTGGTGLSPRDFTPDATLEVIDKEVTGLAEAMRYYSLSKTPHAMLSRAVCGIRKQTLIINFPGSPKAIEENFEVISPALYHAVEIIKGEAGDCQGEDTPGKQL